MARKKIHFFHESFDHSLYLHSNFQIHHFLPLEVSQPASSHQLNLVASEAFALYESYADEYHRVDCYGMGIQVY